jgi:putative phage-type endonuclease
MEERIADLIKNNSLEQQRTDEWHTRRYNTITASEVYKAFEDATPTMKYELVMSKLVPRNKDAEGSGNQVGALIWGTRFEPIAKEIYCNLNGVKIVDLSCVAHPTYSFLGASPDGIILTEDTSSPMYGSLIEFKCPISRKFSESTAVPAHYNDQMQLQMECTQLNQCVYAEFAFKVVSYSEWLHSTAEFKSVIAVVGETVFYKGLGDTSDIGSWRNSIPEVRDAGIEANIKYWVLDKWCSRVVAKDPNWITKNIASIEKTWKEVVAYRESGTFPEKPDLNKLTIFV